MADATSMDLLRAVLDPVRLAVLGAAVHGDVVIGDLSEALDVKPRVIAEAVGSLRASGLLRSDGSLDEEAFRSIARALPAREPGLGEPVVGPWTDEEACVLGRFFAEGRLVEIPSAAHKRRLVLEKIAQEFEPGHRYAERDVNFTIQPIHPDHAAIRRYLVDEGFMNRADGAYWRTGGRYNLPYEPRPERAADHLLTTERDDVALHPYGWEMIDDLIAAADDPRIPVYMGDQFPSPYTREAAEDWLEIATASDPALHYAIYVDGAFAGGVGALLLSSVGTGAAEIGWWINPAYWGQGITTLAARAMIDELFEHRGLMRLWAPVMHPNVASARVAEKVGMAFEGAAPSYYLKRGVRYDQLNYGITKAQWSSRR